MDIRLRWFTGLVFLFVFSSANAVVVSVNDWSYIGSTDTGSTLFRVTETFTTAAELGGTQNLYEYTVENLSNYTASLFRVANPDNLGRTMIGPSSWSERAGAQNFLWETFTASDYLLPGNSLSGFKVYTDGLLPDLTFASYGYTGAGWIMATDSTGARIDIHGELVRSSVPEPASLALMGLGLAGLGFARKKKAV